MQTFMHAQLTFTLDRLFCVLMELFLMTCTVNYVAAKVCWQLAESLQLPEVDLPSVAPWPDRRQQHGHTDGLRFRRRSSS